MDRERPCERDAFLSKCVVVYTTLIGKSYTLVCPNCSCLAQTYITYKRKKKVWVRVAFLTSLCAWILSSFYSYFILTNFNNTGDLTVRYFYHLVSNFVKSSFLNCAAFGIMLFLFYRSYHAYVPEHSCLNCSSVIGPYGCRGFFRLLNTDSNFNKPINSYPSFLSKYLFYSAFLIYLLSCFIYIFYRFY